MGGGALRASTRPRHTSAGSEAEPRRQYLRVKSKSRHVINNPPLLNLHMNMFWEHTLYTINCTQESKKNKYKWKCQYFWFFWNRDVRLTYDDKCSDLGYSGWSRFLRSQRVHKIRGRCSQSDGVVLVVTVTGVQNVHSKCPQGVPREHIAFTLRS